MLAFHGIFGAYGFWLPNDPRGSWSTFVGSWELFRFGPATKIETRRSVAHQPHAIRDRLEAKEALLFPPVIFTGIQARAIGIGFAGVCEQSGYRIHACSILPDHVHVVVQAHHHDPGLILGHLKSGASQALMKQGLHPFANQADVKGRTPMCWARRAWKVYLDDARDVERAVRYVEDNPIKEGKPKQRWSFVVDWNS